MDRPPRKNTGRTITWAPGERHGRLVYQGPHVGLRAGRGRYLCDCGGIHVADRSSVRSGKIQSCGCLAVEQAAARKRPVIPWRGKLLALCDVPRVPGVSLALLRDRLKREWKPERAATVLPLGPEARTNRGTAIPGSPPKGRGEKAP